MNIHIAKVEGMAVGDQARAVLDTTLSTASTNVPVGDFYTEAERVQSLFRILQHHEKNRDLILEQLVVYGAGEKPLSLLNRRDAEEQAIQNCKHELKQFSLISSADDVEFSHLKLLALVSSAGLSMEQVRKAFAACLPERLTKSVSANTLVEMIRTLWTNIPLQTTDGRVPRLEFAEQVARVTPDAQLSQHLQDWVNWNTAKFVPDGRSKPKVEKQVTAVYLMIILQPLSKPRHNQDNEPEASDEYRLNLIFWRSGDKESVEEPWYPLLKGQANGPEDKDDPSVVKLAELPDVLHRVFYRQQESLERYGQRLILEIFVPATLLDCDIDQWRDPYQRRASSRITYGARYPCVIRSTERLQDRYLRPQWRAKWAHYTDGTEFELCTRWLASTQVDLNSLDVDLRQEQDLLCLGLPFLPAGGEWESDLYLLLLDTGLPIGIWHRHPQESISLAKLKDQINGLQLAALRRCLVDIRLEATTDETHLGRQIILFWDDPDRIPALGNRSSILPTNAGGS